MSTLKVAGFCAILEFGPGMVAQLEGGSRVEEGEDEMVEEPAMRNGAWRARLVFRAGGVLMAALVVSVLVVNTFPGGGGERWDLRASPVSLTEEANAAIGNFILPGVPPPAPSTFRRAHRAFHNTPAHVDPPALTVGENESLLNLSRRTVNSRCPERARNEGSTGPKRLDDTRCRWTCHPCHPPL